MKVQCLPPSARRHARQDLVTMESATILRAFGTIYVFRKNPIEMVELVRARVSSSANYYAGELLCGYTGLREKGDNVAQLVLRYCDLKSGHQCARPDLFENM